MSSDSTPRVDRNDLLRSYPAARRSKRVFAAAALDVAFDVVLSEMHRQRLFELCGMVFKGGTALRKFHFGHKSRFSFDGKLYRSLRQSSV